MGHNPVWNIAAGVQVHARKLLGYSAIQAAGGIADHNCAYLLPVLLLSGAIGKRSLRSVDASLLPYISWDICDFAT